MNDVQKVYSIENGVKRSYLEIVMYVSMKV